MSDKTLVIVEAVNKVAKIQHILGDDYDVAASIGHIMDLDPSKMSIDLETFTPSYIINSDKHDVVKKLKAKYKNAKNVLLSSDDDAEGAFISWSLAQILNLKNPKRAIFHEITKEAILKAVKNPEPINENSVNGQKARRMIDRIIGYSVSPLLCKSLGIQKLSAGRVQSVVVRLIMEKEDEIKEFYESDDESSFRTTCEFNKKYKAVLHKIDGDKTKVAKITKLKSMKNIINEIAESKFTVLSVTSKERKQNPSAPYTTATLLQDASRKMGFNTDRTTKVAQSLYANGYVTYIRTDSVTISEEGIKSIGEYIVNKYGEEYHREMRYKTKAKGAQEAHEAIRPVDIKVKGISNCSIDETRLYNLIWKRTVASQMECATFNVNTVDIDISELEEYRFVAESEYLTFDGFLKVYNPDTTDNSDEEDDKKDEKKELKMPKKGDKLSMENLVSTQEYARPPPRYDECSLINKLDKGLGIGRPSTYRSIVTKIQSANYVTIEQLISGVQKKCVILKLDDDNEIIEESKMIKIGEEKKKFTITDLGRSVTNFLMKNFPEIMDYKFTSNMEDVLDEIECGKKKLINAMEEFYETFGPIVEKINASIKDNRPQREMNELGEHPELGHKIRTCIAKFGPIVRMFDENEKIIATVPINKPLTIEKITLEDAIKLFEWPKELGEIDDKVVKLNKGKYGYYITYNDTNTQVKLTDEEADEYTLEQAEEAISEKNKKILWEKKDDTATYTILSGQYGKYIRVQYSKKTLKTKNVKLPFNVDIDKLTLKEVQEIVKKYNQYVKNNSPKPAEKPPKEAKKAPAKKTSTSDDKALIKQMRNVFK
jgi:DNA topoisomerase-1